MYKRVNGVAQAVFLWQGDNLLAELDGTATVKRAEYSYYPGFDNLHAVVINGERLYAHADGLGNVIALTDEAQAVRRTYGYDDWGNDTGTFGTVAPVDADRARWKGALWMGPELDLYYMRNRWYEPATGRFLREDPIGLASGINPLIFGVNNPITNRDPDGRKCEVVEFDITVTNEDGSKDVIKGEKLVCTDITAGDFKTIATYLGGESGQQAAYTLSGFIGLHFSGEIPTLGERQLCLLRPAADAAAGLYSYATEVIGLNVVFNNAYRDRVTAPTGGRPGAGARSLHLAGLAFDINAAQLRPGDLGAFTGIAQSYGFSSVAGDPGHYQFSRDRIPFQQAVGDARRSYARGDCVDANVEAVRARR